MTPRRITVSQANSLGRRIRRSQGVLPDDERLLEDLLADAFDALLAVQDRLRDALPTVSFTPRLKTRDTIVDKLCREPTMALARMRDLGGVRIVEDMNRRQQNVLMGEIREACGGKIVDRRVRPSFGYRALHLEVDHFGICVEIQVRTMLQDRWAQVVELLGDNWGRQLRYGGGPPDPDHEIASGVTRADFWKMVIQMATIIDDFEVEELSGAFEAPENPGEINDARRAVTDFVQTMHAIVTHGAGRL